MGKNKEAENNSEHIKIRNALVVGLLSIMFMIGALSISQLENIINRKAETVTIEYRLTDQGVTLNPQLSMNESLLISGDLPIFPVRLDEADETSSMSEITVPANQDDLTDLSFILTKNGTSDFNCFPQPNTLKKGTIDNREGSFELICDEIEK